MDQTRVPSKSLIVWFKDNAYPTHHRQTSVSLWDSIKGILACLYLILSQRKGRKSLFNQQLRQVYNITKNIDDDTNVKATNVVFD